MRTTTKAVRVMMMPMKPLVILTEAAATFLASPELSIKSQPARIRLTKKNKPARIKTRFKRLTPPLVKRPLMLVARGMLVAGFGRVLILTVSMFL